MKPNVSRLVLAFVAVAATVTATACAGSTTPTSPTVTETVTAPPSTDAVAPVEATPGEPASTEPVPTEPVAKINVPAVVGMDHQEAQDTMQAAGLYNLREYDGSGQGRLLIWDRNWQTIAQDPPAGTLVSPDAVITLTAVKKSD